MLLAVRFRLFQRHRYRNLTIEYVRGLPFVVLPQVFNPRLFPTGVFLAEQYSKIDAGALVLDMGTGTGIGAVLAARYTGRVTAVDINPYAVRCTKINVLLNDLEERVNVRQSDLFEALGGEKFDVVLFNPPFFDGVPRDAEDHAWRGVKVIERFAACLEQHLNAGGYALVVFSSNSDYPNLRELFYAHNLNVEVIAERDIISEILTVYRLSVP
jgi:HemK-related putative methylase